MIARLTAFCLIMALAGPAVADPYPALFDVTGVAADDMLNIRAEPDAGSDRIGALDPDATGVEVIREQTGWGRVNVGEGAGWVSMRYLVAQPGGDYALTQRLDCFGTEPFWSLDILQGQSATLSTPDGQTALPAGLLQTARGRTDRFIVGLGADHVAVIGRMACSDGMSDREFGLEIGLIGASGELTLHAGCCALSQP